MNAMMIAPLMAISAHAPPAPCKNVQEIVASSKVSTLAPDTQLLGLELAAKGLHIDSAVTVSWSLCSVALQRRVYGGWAITSNGVPLMPINDQLVARNDPIIPAEPEPAHPSVPGAHFVSSTSLMIGDLRAGLWVERGGQSFIARYRPGSSDAPIPILRSSTPILGLFYLGAPDAPSGTLKLWQRLPHQAFRYISMSWTEEGVR